MSDAAVGGRCFSAQISDAASTRILHCQMQETRPRPDSVGGGDVGLRFMIQFAHKITFE